MTLRLSTRLYFVIALRKQSKPNIPCLGQKGKAWQQVDRPCIDHGMSESAGLPGGNATIGIQMAACTTKESRNQNPSIVVPTWLFQWTPQLFKEASESSERSRSFPHRTHAGTKSFCSRRSQKTFLPVLSSAHGSFLEKTNGVTLS